MSGTSFTQGDGGSRRRHDEFKNLKAIVSSGYTYVIASRLNKIPYAVADYQKTGELTDGQIVTEERQDYRIIYQYRQKRAVLDRQNIAKQIEKAQRVVEGIVPAHRDQVCHG